MKSEDAGPRPASKGVRVPWGTGILILLPTLAVWAFFYVEKMPLDAPTTSFVALGMTFWSLWCDGCGHACGGAQEQNEELWPQRLDKSASATRLVECVDIYDRVLLWRPIARRRDQRRLQRGPASGGAPTAGESNGVGGGSGPLITAIPVEGGGGWLSCSGLPAEAWFFWPESHQ
jgi:hypothetical protein